MSNSNGGLLHGKFPAIVKSYNPETRECIIETPTSGEVDAEIEYPIGDKSKNTEIEILAGDQVWCEFIQGDTRRALITGYRNPQTGNSKGTRRWHHANIELTGDSIVFKAGGATVVIGSGDMTVNGISATKHLHLVVKEGQDTKVPH